MNDVMTKHDRDQLASLAKLRGRVAKAAVAERAAELLADVERQLSAVFSSRDAAFADITAAAQAAVRDADDKVAAICKERGIAEELRPSISIGWYQRGANAEASRRSELRKLAQANIEHAGRRAKSAIEARTADVLTELISGSLQSDEARRFLESIPSATELMPQMMVTEHLELSGGLA